MRKAITIGLIGIFLSLSSLANAATGILSGGGESGEYTKTICPAIDPKMKALGQTAVCKPGPGSGGNFELVLKGEIYGGQSQGDVALLLMSTNPAYEWFLPIGQIAPEVPWLAVSNNGKVKSFSDLSSVKGITIGVDGGKTGGSFITLTEIFTKAIPELKEAIASGALKIKTLDGIAPDVAYNYLTTGQLDAVFFMMMPNPANSRISTVANSGGKLMFLPIDNPALTKFELNGKVVYQAVDAPISETQIKKVAASRAKAVWAAMTGAELKKEETESKGQVVKSIATMSTIIVDPTKADREWVKALTSVVTDPNLLPDTSVAGQAKAWYDGFVNKAKAMAAAATK